MERAETTARLLDVGYRMSLFPDLSGYNNEWESVLAASGTIDSYKKNIMILFKNMLKITYFLTKIIHHQFTIVF